MILLRKILIGFAGILVLLITLNSLHGSQVYKGYVANEPTLYTEISSNNYGSYIGKTFSFEGVDGVQVPVSVALPSGENGPFPSIIMLYGIGQKMTFLEDIAEIFTKQGFALYMMEQYNRGERKAEDSNSISEFFGLRRRSTLNLIETRRLIDTLASRPEVDMNELYFWGISFGTITGVPTFSEESRFKAAVFSIGGGGMYSATTSSKTYHQSDFFGKLGGMVFGYYLTPIDPLPYAKFVSGRPVLFENALQDQIIPVSAAKALHDATGEPKKIIWYDTNHEGTLNEQTMNYFIDGLAWLKQQYNSP